MGLLDFSGFVGDDTAKDEFGMTQADRRQPLFTGLLKAGMLGMAAGENITPGQRAQLLGQVGGAITDIPEAMNRNRAEAAQMQIRRQQFQTGQQKLDQQRKIQAYAQTPEFQASIANLPEHQKAALKIAVESGDIDTFGRLMTGIDTSAMKQERFAFDREKQAFLEQQKLKELELKVQQAGGWGNSQEGRMRTVLDQVLTDPSFANDPKYREAWEHFNQDQRPVTIGNYSTVLPRRADLDNYPKPTSAPLPGSPNATKPPTPTEPPPVGQPRVNADKSVTWTDQADPTKVLTEYPDGRVKVEKDGKTTIEDPKPIPDDIQFKFATMEGDRNQIHTAKEKFLALWKQSTPGGRLKSIAMEGTPLRAAWTNLALAAKGDALYKLGVLNEGDLPQLQAAIPDPSKITNLFTSEADLESSLSQLTASMDAKVKGTKDEYLKGRRRAPPVGGGKRKVKEFRDGKLVEVEVD